jgi:hypothetical protein
MGSAVGLALMLVGGFLYLRNPLPTLTRSEFDAAVARWSEHGPRDYDMDITVTGNQPGVVHVEVRDGQPTAMTRDGVSPRQRRTWFPWTVLGQFDTIEFELDAATAPQGTFGGQPGSQLVLRAEFDPRYGYPRRYQRIVMGQQMDAGWEVTRFMPVEGPSGGRQ